MSLSANQTTFQTKLEAIFKKYSQKAFESTFDVDVGEDATSKTIRTAISKKFAEEFSKCAADLSNEITQHVLQTQLTPVLVAPPSGGPVAGTILIA